MVFVRSLPLATTALAFVAWIAPAGSSHGMTMVKKKKTPFLFDITTFTTTLSLPVSDKVETVRMPLTKMKLRLERSRADKTVEPLSVILGPKDDQLVHIAEKVAMVGKEDDLVAYLRQARAKAKPIKKGSTSKTIFFDDTGFALLDKEAFADLYSRKHHNLEVLTSTLKRDKKLRREFSRQIRPFFKKKQRNRLMSKILKEKPISVDKELLPEFPRKMIKKYIVFRGPNCFHAALAFHSPAFTSSSLINVKKETGYHRAMINYDELWRAINHNFYEINPDEHALKYGDMLVFFDVPEDEGQAHPVNFRWIRHTATYLFGGYTFSKGSKSPNTPYTVRTLAEEWKTWKKFTKNLGVKVFRRARKHAKKTPPLDLTDWVY